MSAPANGLTRALPDALASLVEHLPELEDRERYAALVAYVQALPPGDELVQVAQLLGFLTLIGRQLPEALAAEQGKLQQFLGQAYRDLQQEVHTNGRYHEQLNERLNQLPAEIAAGVKPDAIAKAMGESFRQQLLATGIEETKAFLTQATRDLKGAAGAVDAAVKPLAARYGTLADEVNSKVISLTRAASQLQGAADAVARKNADLLMEVGQLQWWILPTVALLLLLVGAFLGSGWEQRHSSDAVFELQNQVQQLQQDIKALPATLTPPPPPSKHPKK